MKRKILLGIGIVTVIAFLCLNISLSKDNKDGDFSINKMFEMAQANAEGEYDIYCNYYCRPGGDCCSLHVGFNDGTTGYIYCYTMYF
jgi:hypothetical protein